MTFWICHWASIVASIWQKVCKGATCIPGSCLCWHWQQAFIIHFLFVCFICADCTAVQIFRLSARVSAFNFFIYCYCFIFYGFYIFTFPGLANVTSKCVPLYWNWLSCLLHWKWCVTFWYMLTLSFCMCMRIHTYTHTHTHKHRCTHTHTLDSMLIVASLSNFWTRNVS